MEIKRGPLLAVAREEARAMAQHVVSWPSRQWHRHWKLRKIRQPWGKEIRVNYGRLKIDGGNKVTIGGAVKLGHLRTAFGEALEEFNILYLVSSALPRHAEELVRAAKRRGVRLVWNQNGVAYRAWCGESYRWRNRPMQKLLPQADYVVYQSEFCRASADIFVGPYKGESRILYNPVDLGMFSPPRKKPDISRWKLLAAGTNHHFYRVKAPLECLYTLLQKGYDVELTIAGANIWPNGEREARAYAKKLGLGDRVSFLPAFRQDEAPLLYQRSHVLLHPKYKDPCPTVPIEAMACGIPVVGSASGGMCELVQGDAGVLLEVPDDWDRDHWPEGAVLAGGVETLMNDLPKHSAAARARAEQMFDAKAWIDAHREIFQHVLEQR